MLLYIFSCCLSLVAVWIAQLHNEHYLSNDAGVFSHLAVFWAHHSRLLHQLVESQPITAKIQEVIIITCSLKYYTETVSYTHLTLPTTPYV